MYMLDCIYVFNQFDQFSVFLFFFDMKQLAMQPKEILIISALVQYKLQSVNRFYHIAINVNNPGKLKCSTY